MAEVLPADVASDARGDDRARVGIRGTETIEYTLELSGDARDFEARLVPVGPDEVVAVVRDVTERNQVNTELERRWRLRTRRTGRPASF